MPAAERIADVFAPTLASAPKHEALVTRRVRWSYAEIDEMAARAAAVLAALGVQAGDRVAASLPNEADIVIAFHGAMRLGAIWVGINQALAPPEKAFLLADSGTSLLLGDSATAAALDAHRADVPELRTVITLDDWRTAIDTTAPLRGLPAADPFAPAALAYTSGTTGRPKGVVHSQHNLLVPGAMLVASRNYTADLRKGDCLPLTILNMLVLTTLLVAQAGGTCVIMDQLYAEGVAEWVERERVDVWNGPPPVLHTLAHDDSIPPASLRTLREAWSGGAALPEALLERFKAKFGVNVIGSYGLSEAPTVVSMDPPDGTHVAGASGRPLPHLDVFAVDDSGARLPRGETGEICVAPTTAGPDAGRYRLPLGYWQRPDADDALAGGVLRTGDVGVVDEAGWLTVKDRKNLMIIRGGANVYPAEVERVVLAVDGVAGAAVFGVPDERLGERVVAAVELNAGAVVTADEILDRCTIELARYKVPERIVIVERLPRNAMDKVDRTAVRDLA